MKVEILLPDGESVQLNLSIRKQASDQHKNLIVPSLEAKHYGGCSRQFQKLTEARESLQAKTIPRTLALFTHQDVHKLCNHYDPP